MQAMHTGIGLPQKAAWLFVRPQILKCPGDGANWLALALFLCHSD